MSRRRRALLFTVLAGVAAIIAMSLVSGYSSSVVDSYGAMRPVVVVTNALPAGASITGKAARTGFEVRRVPARFSPAGTISDAGQAVGLETSGPLYVGSYLTSNLLRRPESERKNDERTPGPGRHAVEIAVSGAGALAGTSGRVDVLVTTEPTTAGSGRTYVAARGIPLLAVAQTGASDAGVGLTQVTLGLTRRQAVELVEAESFARKVTILPGRPGA